MNLSAEIAKARNALQSGDSRAAIQIYKELLKDRPNDIRLQERFGDLLREDAQLAAAAWTYRAVANYWEEEGFFLRAVVIYKKLLKCERDDRTARLRLAALYQRLHLHHQAKDEYLRLAELFHAVGNDDEQIHMLRSALELDVADTDVRMQLFRSLKRENREESAAELLAEGLNHARDEMDVDAYLKLAPRYLELRPEDRAVAKRMKLLLQAQRREPGMPEASDALATDTSDTTKPDVRRLLTARPFSLSSEVLLEDPEHLVAHAIRARRHGDALECLRLLESDEADDHPYAAMFERSVAQVDVGKYAEAIPSLDLLAILPVLSMQDRELVWFYIGMAHEGLQEYDKAREWFERIEATSPGQSHEVAERLARYQDADGE